MIHKILFLASKNIGYECLDFLLLNRKKLNAEVIGIVTKINILDNPKYDINQLAKENGIKVYESINNQAIGKFDIDFIISVQHHEILKQHHINYANKMAVNLHLAPVPEYRGCNQFSFAILDNATEFGTTLHQINTNIDSGDILFEKRFAIPQNCWAKDLYQLTNQHSIDLFKEKIGDILNGKCEAIPQSQFANRKKGFHLRKEIKTVKQIDLNWAKEKIERHIRATYFPPFDPPYFMLNDQKVFFDLEHEED